MVRTLMVCTGVAALGVAPAAAAPMHFRGEYICGATRDLPGQLRAPADATVDGDKIQFARPLYSFDGTRVVGTELADGKIDPAGHVELGSQWSFKGSVANAHYSGNFADVGGTLVGAQVWSKGGNSTSRACVAAFVAAPKFAGAPDDR